MVRLKLELCNSAHAMVKATRDLVEQHGYEAIYGDTDSIFTWLKRRHTNEQAHVVAGELVKDINGSTR